MSRTLFYDSIYATPPAAEFNAGFQSLESRRSCTACSRAGRAARLSRFMQQEQRQEEEPSCRLIQPMHSFRMEATVLRKVHEASE